jgi:hypothetical protein
MAFFPKAFFLLPFFLANLGQLSLAQTGPVSSGDYPPNWKGQIAEWPTHYLDATAKSYDKEDLAGWYCVTNVTQLKVPKGFPIKLVINQRAALYVLIFYLFLTFNSNSDSNF